MVKLISRYNEKTGLDTDYRNAWTHLPPIYSRRESKEIEEEFLRVIATPVETYFEYLKNSWPMQVEEARKMAKPDALAKLEQNTLDYNELPIEEKRKREVMERYYENASRIMRGE